MKKEPAIVITSAQDALTKEQNGRQRKYLLAMAIRTICFIAMIFLPNPYRWISLAGALLLPYIAVVIANAGREQSSGDNAIIKETRRELN